MLELAEALLMAGLARQESRGAHFRTDFPVRDDEKFLGHSMVLLDRRHAEAGIEAGCHNQLESRWERKY